MVNGQQHHLDSWRAYIISIKSIWDPTQIQPQRTTENILYEGPHTFESTSLLSIYHAVIMAALRHFYIRRRVYGCLYSFLLGRDDRERNDISRHAIERIGALESQAAGFNEWNRKSNWSSPIWNATTIESSKKVIIRKLAEILGRGSAINQSITRIY